MSLFSIKGNILQGFRPNRFATGTSIDLSGVLAWAPCTDVTYSYDGGSTTGSLLQGSVRIVSEGATTLTLSASATVELMDE
jgi:hypothetical protein